MKTAREAALLALYEIEYNGAYSNIALKNILKNTTLDERDRAFATALVYGVTSHKLTLDYMIEQFSGIRLKKLSKYILLIVRMGLFQIRYMDKVPMSAAVDESVRLAKRYAHKAAAGYVNGVLRTAARTEPEEPKEAYLRYSFAREAVQKLYDDYGVRAEPIMQALNREPEMIVRANRLKTDRDTLAKLLGATICPLAPDALYVKRLDASSSREFLQGLYSVQDAAPMAACLALSPQEGELVMDVCAAPGGKTTYIAELMHNKGRIIAFDIHEHRTELIKKNAVRLGTDIIETRVHDARTAADEFIGRADKVLADVPCSGLGIARRKPELKYKTDFEELPALQLEILKAAAEYLKPGGELVYSTCTLYKDENERVMRRFLEENPGFELQSMKTLLPDGFCEEEPGMMTVLPDSVGCDGFFISKIKRN